MRLFLVLVCLMPAGFLLAQTTAIGRVQFDGHCAVCHGKEVNGGELGPAIVMRLPSYNDGELATLMHTGLPNSGMPASNLNDQETTALIRFLLSLNPSGDVAIPKRANVKLGGSRTLEGVVLNQTDESVSHQILDLAADAGIKLHRYRGRLSDGCRPGTRRSHRRDRGPLA